MANTISEVVAIFKKEIPNRTPSKVARKGNVWYVYSENKLNGGQPIINTFDAPFYIVDGNKVSHISMMKLPEDLNFIKV